MAVTNRMRQLLVFGLFAVLGGAIGIAIGKLGKGSGAVARVLDATSGWDLLALPVLALAVIAVHEFGHVVGGWSRGMRLLMFIAGPFALARTPRGLRPRFVFNLGTLGGLASMLPGDARPLREQMGPLIIGGPLASLLLALAAAALAAGLDGRPALYAGMTAVLSTGIFLVTATPLRAGGYESDGLQWLGLRRDPARIERRARLVSLVGQSVAGTRPRELEAGTLAATLAETGGGDAPYDVAAWLFAASHALDHGREDEAAAWFDRVAARIAEYPDGFRQALAVELAIHEALYRGRREDAKAWLAQGRGGVVDRSRRALAEAAIAALEGDTAAARRGIAQARARVGQAMDAGGSLLWADQIARLEARLPAG